MSRVLCLECTIARSLAAGQAVLVTAGLESPGHYYRCGKRDVDPNAIDAAVRLLAACSCCETPGHTVIEARKQ